MASLTVVHADGLVAFLQSADRLLAAAASPSERDLLGQSRCHGWSRMDVLAHVLAGWQEMLGAFIAPTDAPPDVDAASFWGTAAGGMPEADPVPALMAQRRRTDAYTRPSALLAQLRDVAATVATGASNLGTSNVRFQGHVMTSGDLLAIWAVENAIHHLDLDLPVPGSPAALRLARRTCDALLPAPLPPAWADEEAVLVACGRTSRQDVPAAVADHLPVI